MDLGPYEILSELGRGGMGRVYSARHRPTGAHRALKVLEHTSDLDALDRFNREAQALARAGGQGVVPVHDSGVSGHTLWFAMEIMPGGSLRARLEKRRSFPWREAVAIVLPIAHALGRCHAIGLVHRDVKPENVLFDDQGAPRLADFGCVRDLGARALTATGTWIGTPGYMAPEQLEGKRVGPPADVFALGAILYELVQGAKPYEASSVMKFAVLAAKGRRDPLGNVPGELQAIVDRALLSNPERRTRDGNALAAELTALLGGKTAAPRSRWPFALMGALAVVGALAVSRPASKPTPEVVAPPSSATTTAHEPPRDAHHTIQAWTSRATRIPVDELAAAAEAYPAAASELAGAALTLGIEGEDLPPSLRTRFKEKTPLAAALRAVSLVADELALEAGRARFRKTLVPDSPRLGLTPLDSAWETLMSRTLDKTYPALLAPIFSGVETVLLEEAGASVGPEGPQRSPFMQNLARQMGKMPGLTPLLGGLLAIGRTVADKDGPGSRARLEKLVVASDLVLARGERLLALALLENAIVVGRYANLPPDATLSERALRLGREEAGGALTSEERFLAKQMLYRILVDCGVWSNSAVAAISRHLEALALARREGLGADAETNAVRWFAQALVDANQWARLDELLPDPPEGALAEVLALRARILSDAGDAPGARAMLEKARERAATLKPDDVRRAFLDAADRYVNAKK